MEKRTYTFCEGFICWYFETENYCWIYDFKVGFENGKLANIAQVISWQVVV